MRKSSAGPGLSSRETMTGAVYTALQLFVLPSLLYWVNGLLPGPMNEAEINFTFAFVNFMAMLLIYHSFLGNSLQQATRHPIQLCQSVILGLAGYYACNFCTLHLIRLLVPGFVNHNDEAIFAMGSSSAYLVTLCTLVLVPPVEECIYRGLIFRNLYGKNKFLAYGVSIVLFALVHILGYLPLYGPLELLMAVLQYLPAGLCLGWCYAKAGTIFAPIVMHAAINAITLFFMR